jgi:hypothetical protein
MQVTFAEATHGLWWKGAGFTTMVMAAYKSRESVWGPLATPRQRDALRETQLGQFGDFVGLWPEAPGTRWTMESIQKREERWVIVDLVGKGRHIHTVPVGAGQLRGNNRHSVL